MTRLREALLAQSRSCASLGSPFMAQLCRVLADRLAPGTPLTDRLFGWQGDVSSNGASLPLRLAGALHALKRRGDAALAAVYPPATVDDETLWQAVDSAMSREAAFIDRFLDTAPQTNEVRRSAALIAVALWLAERHPLPLILSELGASAGLNLSFDRYALVAGAARRGPREAALTLAPNWRGPPPPDLPLSVAERRGCDLNPLDRGRDAERLFAYLWPDQPEREALTRAALALPTPRVDREDAADWLATRLTPTPGHLHLIFHTIAWQYFPAAVQSRARALIETAGAAATTDAPLAWFGMEADGTGPGAALTLRLWPGDVTLPMGRADFHGRWIDWRP